MKKTISLLLTLVLCLSLCACGKSEAVKNVEAMIDALGEITLESIDAIRLAEDAYNALPEDEQKKVGNRKVLSKARDTYYELALVGEWTERSFDMWNVEIMYDTVQMVLNADMTGQEYAYYNEEFTWSVKDCVLNIDCGGTVHAFDVAEVDGKITLSADNRWPLLPVKDFHALLDDMFLIVDLAEVDIADYCELYIYHHEGVDDWGTPTGESSDSIRIGSKAYRDGWCYFNAKDVAIEVFFPAYEETHEYSDGTSNTYTHNECTLIVDDQVLFLDTLMGIKSNSSDDWYRTITIDQLSFGRAKGLLYFVNLDYVTDFPYVDDLNRGITLFNGQGVPYAPWIEDLWDDNHPY